MQATAIRKPVDLAGNTDTSLLKLIALISMAIDHSAVAFFGNPTDLRVIGRIALPLYAWCLIVGCEKTRDIFRYALRMLALAVISQPIYVIALNHNLLQLNILFLLALGVLGIAAIQKKWHFSQYWGPLLCLLVVGNGWASFDYGWRGLAFLFVLYLARGSLGGLIAAYLSYALFWGSTSGPFSVLFGMPITLYDLPGVGVVCQSLFRMQTMIWLALPLIAIPTHSGLRMPKWLGYALYPAHLVVIALIKLAMGTPLASMLAGF